MEKLQYDSFYKFLVSVGTILVVAPIIGIHSLFNGSYDIILSQETFDNLSELSLSLLEIREKSINIAFKIIPIIFLLIIGIGLLFVFIGGKKWYEIQKSLDDSIKVDLDTKKFNYRQLSATEIVEKAIKESVEIQNVNDTTALSKQSQRMIKGLQIENLCFTYLENKLKKEYLVRQNIAIGKHEYDIVATSKLGAIDIIYEIKYLNGTTTNVGSILSRAIPFLEKAKDDYEAITKRSSHFYITIITPKDYVKTVKENVEKYLVAYDISTPIIIECIAEEELSF